MDYNNKNPLITSFHTKFSETVHLLWIEDNSVFNSLLCNDIFHSPILNVKPVYSFNDAKSAIFSSKLYHCWVLDLTLTHHNDGLELLHIKNNFPYSVILTGCSSVEDATKAMKGGAYCCYDKKNLFTEMFNFFIYSVCSLSALSFPLKAMRPSNKDGFFLLLDHFIQTPEEWAEKYFRNFRSIWDFCKMNTELTPKQFLYLFHAIHFVLLSDCLAWGFPGYEFLTGQLGKKLDFYLQCLKFVLNNSDTIYAPLYL